MRRRLFNLAAALSLLLLIAGATAYAISFNTKIAYPFMRNGRQWEAAIERGDFILSDQPQCVADRQQISAATQKEQAALNALYALMASTNGHIDGNVVAEAARSRYIATVKSTRTYMEHLFRRVARSPQISRRPVGLPLALTAILPICWGASRVSYSRRQWQRRGQCVQCGYDLRATPEQGGALLARCPECGTTECGTASA